MNEMKDSFGKSVGRGFIAFSFIGFSGSGCTQHLIAVKVACNGVGYTLKSKVECPGHSYKRGTPLSDIMTQGKTGSWYSRMLTDKQFKKFPHGEIALIFNKGDFKKICQTGRIS